MREFQNLGRDGYLRVNGKVGRPECNHLLSLPYSGCEIPGRPGGRAASAGNIADVLLRPKRLICLGRMEYPPAEPVWLPDGIQDTDLVTALSEYPFLGGFGETRENLELLIEDETGPIVWNDQPISFRIAPLHIAAMRSLFVPNPA